MEEFKTTLKNVEDKTRASKKSIVEENFSVCKSFSAEVKKLEERNNKNDIKIEQHQRKVVLLKEHNKDLAASLQVERSKSRLAIEQLLDDAEDVMMEAKAIERAANNTVDLERLNLSLNLHKERDYHASPITQSKSVSYFTMRVIKETHHSVLSLCLIDQ